MNQFSLVQKTSLIPVLPRARGADGLGVTQAMARSPLPPRTRGRQGPGRLPGADLASTPAHAGPASPPRRSWWSSSLYPRARGADSDSGYRRLPRAPLPPRTRGRQHGDGLPEGVEPSTPAHAGPTEGRSIRPGRSYLYPRARGADATRTRRMDLPGPLPPRTRGRPAASASTRIRPTSTPAHAGPTCRRWSRGTARGLYPRARGANGASWAYNVDREPLPPRTRGQLKEREIGNGNPTSTPAHAGPTSPRATSTRARALYPRARGANA